MTLTQLIYSLCQLRDRMSEKPIPTPDVVLEIHGDDFGGTFSIASAQAVLSIVPDKETVVKVILIAGDPL